MGLPAALEAHRFTTDTASAAGKRSVEVRREKRSLAKRDDAYRVALRAAFQRGHLADESFECALEVVRRIRDGKIEVRNGAEAAALITALTTIARLESGEATSLTASLHATLTDDERASRLAELRARIGDAVDAPSTATPVA